MMVSDWPHAIAHVDCDAFYASCEAARHPELRGRAICVLSSQNAIVVAKCYAAKALGITTGMPVWEARKLAPQAVFLAADFRYYGQVSGQLFAILRSFSPAVEVYSIDEGFVDMNGIRSLWRKSFTQLADEIRRRIRCETGITASVGIATTRMLAKMASEVNKPDGSTVVPGRRTDAFLRDIDIAAVPGIGRNRAALLRKFAIRTAGQFVRLDDAQAQRLLGRQGVQIKYELSGRTVWPLQLQPALPKSVARTASIGRVTAERGLLAAHLSRHVMRLVADLVARRLLTRRLSLFLTRASFERSAVTLPLGLPTNSLKRIMDAAKGGFDELFRAGERYRGCGVVALDISRDGEGGDDLFGVMAEDRRQEQLMLAVNAINRKYGRQTMLPAAAGRLRDEHAAAPRFRYPLFYAG
jgi:DNA polymerase-4/DNA polymerase V